MLGPAPETRSGGGYGEIDHADDVLGPDDAGGQGSDRESDRVGALRTLRILWGAVVGGLVLLGPTALMLRGAGGAGGEGEVGAVEEGGGLGLVELSTPFLWSLLGVGVVTGFFLRNQIYKKHWRGLAVSAEGYLMGNVVFFALVEGPATVAVIFLFAGASLLPTLLPVLLATGILLLNYPSGRPMQPVEPRLGTAERRGGDGTW